MTTSKKHPAKTAAEPEVTAFEIGRADAAAPTAVEPQADPVALTSDEEKEAIKDLLRVTVTRSWHPIKDPDQPVDPQAEAVEQERDVTDILKGDDVVYTDDDDVEHVAVVDEVFNLHAGAVRYNLRVPSLAQGRASAVPQGVGPGTLR